MFSPFWIQPITSIQEVPGVMELSDRIIRMLKDFGNKMLKLKCGDIHVSHSISYQQTEVLFPTLPTLISTEFSVHVTTNQKLM